MMLLTVACDGLCIALRGRVVSIPERGAVGNRVRSGAQQVKVDTADHLRREVMVWRERCRTR